MSLFKVLIISPYFPPSNAADMQRVRISLPYFKEFGWDATVVAVDPKYSDVVKDDLLTKSLPADLKIQYVKAVSKKITSKFGLGSLALRSMWAYRAVVSEILKHEKFDLIYFSTTQFPLCILGVYWKKRFGVPYVIDMQDPWHSEYYKDKPKDQQPKKYWFSYRLHRYLEPKAMKYVDGLISVSGQYIANLKERYPRIKNVPSATITFGAFEHDLEIAAANGDKFRPMLKSDFINIVYVGRGGNDMHKATTPVFKALKKGIEKQPVTFNKLKFWFIGTSYAPAGEGVPTIAPLAEQYGVAENVIEITDRISYYHSLLTLQHADALFIPGSDDPQYTASKIHLYLLTRKPLLAVFNEKSNVVEILNTCADHANLLTFKNETSQLVDAAYSVLEKWGGGLFATLKLKIGFRGYEARTLTAKQVELFNKVIKAE